jgi:ferric-dicitrate binding protein FerR (iron transport regulator)
MNVVETKGKVMKFAPPKDEPSMPARDPLERLSAYEAGELSDDDAAEVRAWLATSSEASDALRRLQRLRQLTTALPGPQLREGRKHALGDRLDVVVHAQQRRRRITLVAGAAALAAAAVVAVGWRHAPRDRAALATAPTHLRTGAGDFQLLPIGDRAVAFVGEQTEIETHPGQTPAVRLIRGSVRLMVQRRPSEPFVVSTPAAEVAVLGTEFDVAIVEGATDVNVVRGVVEVRNSRGKRRLWARESARARPGEAPRLWVQPQGVVSEGAPEVETHPAPP